MICPTCADAAARRAPRDQHCTDPTCPCGHRTDRYRPIDTPGWSTTLHEAGAHAAQQLTAQLLTQWVPACENGRHYDHPGETCEEYEAYCEAARQTWENTFGAILATHLTPMSEVPATFRGPDWPTAATDAAPLREVGAQSPAERPSTVREAWRRYEMRGDKVPLRHLNAPLHAETTKD